MKLNQIQFNNFKSGIEGALDHFKHGDRTAQLTSAALAELYKKVHGLSLFPKKKYSIKFTEVQKVAVVHAIENGLFAETTQMSIACSPIMLELHRQLPTPTNPQKLLT